MRGTVRRCVLIYGACQPSASHAPPKQEAVSADVFPAGMAAIHSPDLRAFSVQPRAEAELEEDLYGDLISPQPVIPPRGAPRAPSPQFRAVANIPDVTFLQSLDDLTMQAPARAQLARATPVVKARWFRSSWGIPRKYPLTRLPP
jgi:hypothetical protein